MRFSSLQEWLSWQEQLHLSEIDLGLSRVGLVAERLGLTTAKLKSAKIITVAGTNGKGSCVVTLEKLLLSAGKNVGTYTSPHLLQYNERVRVNGTAVADQLFCEAFEVIDQARGDVSLTYFEFGTLAAFWILKQAKLDVLVLEVGLGGRLDAVNIIDADIAVITAIDVDHSDWLGSDRETIGLEKAGILRPGVPLVYADSKPVASILNQAEKLSCECYVWNEDFVAEQKPGAQLSEITGLQWAPQILSWKGRSKAGAPLEYLELPGVVLPLLSVAAALQVVHILDIDWTLECLGTALSDTHLAGRNQLMQRDSVTFLLDVAHNPAAAMLLREKLTQLSAKPKKLFAILGMMADKDVAAALAPFIPIVDHWYCCDLPGFVRAAKASKLAEHLTPHSVAVTTCDSVKTAVEQVLPEATQNDLVLVLGSFITVAAAMPLLESRSVAASNRDVWPSE